MIWTPYDWLNKDYSFYVEALVIIGSWHGLKKEAHHSNQPNKSKLTLCNHYFPLTYSFKQMQDRALQL